MYAVYFVKDAEQLTKCIEADNFSDEAYVFMSSINSSHTAQRIADNLESENFVLKAWADRE